MLLNSILLPFLTLLMPFQHPALDELRTTRSGPHALTICHTPIARGTLCGILLASVFSPTIFFGMKITATIWTGRTLPLPARPPTSKYQLASHIPQACQGPHVLTRRFPCHPPLSASTKLSSQTLSMARSLQPCPSFLSIVGIAPGRPHLSLLMRT